MSVAVTQFIRSKRFDPGGVAPTKATRRRSRIDQRRLKRILDVLAASVLLVTLAPILVAVAVAVWLSSPGPVIFRQQRIGAGGRPFTVYKFRSMRQDGDPAVHQTYYSALVRGDAPAQDGYFKLIADPRITRVGRVLRRFSLDEMPQLLNVLEGNMSLVGPRPPLAYEVALYGDREYRRLSVVPGLTGLWQVSGRAKLTFHQMIDLDLAYVDRWSLWLDLRILARTPAAVLAGRGAC